MVHNSSPPSDEPRRRRGRPRAFDPETAPREEGKPPELLLPEVVGQAVAAGRARIRVVASNSRCIGLTHPGDLPLVRKLVAEGLSG